MATQVDGPLRFDKRILERNLRGGILSREAYEAHLAELPDVAEKAEWVPVPGSSLESDERREGTPSKGA